MIVLTLSQPWATMCVRKFKDMPHPPKRWETRAWRPSKKNHRQMMQEGFLIHASKPPADTFTRCRGPFLEFLPALEPLPQGSIIGHAFLGRVMTTHDWIRTVFKYTEDKVMLNEKLLGDYAAGRYAWELIGAHEFKTPIPVKGSLALWQYKEPINLLEQ